MFLSLSRPSERYYKKEKRGTDRSFHRTGSGKPWRKISNSPHARIHTDARAVSHSSPLKIYQIYTSYAQNENNIQ